MPPLSLALTLLISILEWLALLLVLWRVRTLNALSFPYIVPPPSVTSPPSETENTSVVLSYKFKISPEPVWVMIPAGNVLAADTLNNSTSRRVVFKVVKSPFTVKSPERVKSFAEILPEDVIFPTDILSVDLRTAFPDLP